MANGGYGFIKWVLFPGALAALGYFIVGPRLGGEIVEKVGNKIATEVNRASNPQTPPAAPAVDEDRNAEPEPVTRAAEPAEPEVEVKVRAVEEARPVRRPIRRRRTETPREAAVATAPRPDAPAAEPAESQGGDEGGSGGAAATPPPTTVGTGEPIDPASGGG